MSGSFGIIFTQNRTCVLLVKRRDIPIWNLPGGHIEQGETPEQAVVRETFEETGYKVEITRNVGNYLYPKKKKINYTFECTIIGGVATLSKESKEIREFLLGELPEMITPHNLIYISDALAGEKNLIVKELEGYDLSFWRKGITHPWALFKYLLTRIGIHWNT